MYNISVTSLFISLSPFFIIYLLSCLFLLLTFSHCLTFSCCGSLKLTLPEQRSRAVVMVKIMADDALKGCKVTDGSICKW